MIKNILTHIDGIELYGVLSILLFFAVFGGMLVWAFCLRRADLDAMRCIPLEERNGSGLEAPGAGGRSPAAAAEAGGGSGSAATPAATIPRK